MPDKASSYGQYYEYPGVIDGRMAFVTFQPGEGITRVDSGDPAFDLRFSLMATARRLNTRPADGPFAPYVGLPPAALQMMYDRVAGAVEGVGVQRGV